MGVARESLLGRHLGDVIGETAYAALRPHVDTALAGERVDFVSEVPYPTGVGTVRASYVPHRGVSGDVLGFVALISDITEQKRAEDALRDSERELSDFFDNAAVGLHWVGPDGTVLRVNRAELELLGYERGEYVGHHISEFHADPGAIADILTRLARGETLSSYQARLRCKDGSIRHVLISSNVRWKDGAFAHTRCLTRDITERHEAEEQLRRANEEMEERILERTAELVKANAIRAAIEKATLAGIAAVDLGGRQTYVNPAFCRMLQREESELLGAVPPFVYWPPEETARIAEAFALATDGKAAPEGFELRFMRKDGERFFVQLLLSPLEDEGGAQTGWVASITDITERKRHEERLRRSQAQLAEAQRLAGAGSWEWDIGRNELCWSEELCRIYGLTPETAPRTFQEFLEHVHPEDWDRTREAVQQVHRTGQPFRFEERIVRPDGSVRTLFSQGEVLRDAKGEPEKLLGSCQDITARKQTEEERAQLDRAQAARAEAEKANRLKDEFLATLSHELRNPLNAIVGWAHLLRVGGLDGPRFARAVESIERNALIQNQLISDILDVQRITSGKLRLERKPIDIAKPVDAALDTVRPAAQAKRIELRLSRAPDAGLAMADADRVQQIVWNLLSNAVKFTQEGGHVEAAITRRDSHVELTVEDDGPGIPTDFLPYVFDRFRQANGTSSRRQGGLGLGLAIVRSLVELHGGTVAAEASTKGTGARFRVRLPYADASATAAVSGSVREGTDAAEKSPGSDPSLHGTRVLVLDNQADARELVATVLERRGADVVLACSAADGLAAMDRQAFDVLLSDVEMPDDDGYAFMRSVRARPPDRGGLTPAAALTAYAGAADRERALRAGFQVHVSKPIEPSDLVSIVASLAASTTRDGRTPESHASTRHSSSASPEPRSSVPSDTR